MIQILHIFMQSPSGIVTGIAHGTKSLVRSTVYALSDAASQITKSAHKVLCSISMFERICCAED